MAKLINQPLDYGLYSQPIRVEPASVTWLIDLYRRRLEQIATLCQERGISLVLASEAELFFRSDLILDAMAARVERDRLLTMAELEYYLQGRLNRTAREVAEAHGLRFFDGEAALLTADKRRNVADQIHPNENGAALLARGLADALAPGIRAAPGGATAPSAGSTWIDRPALNRPSGPPNVIGTHRLGDFASAVVVRKGA